MTCKLDVRGFRGGGIGPRSCDCLSPCLARRAAQAEWLSCPRGQLIALLSRVPQHQRQLPIIVNWPARVGLVLSYSVGEVRIGSAAT